MARGEGEAATAESAVGDGNELLVSATVWADGEAPQRCDPDEPLPSTGIRWFDVAPSATPEALLVPLKPICAGLELEMLEDLLVPDKLPENVRWNNGEVRLASTFAVYPADQVDWGRKVEPSPEARYQEVEILAGADWLITMWHQPCLYRGMERKRRMTEPIGKAKAIDASVKKWRRAGARVAGDLGVLVMHELALTYAPAHRHFRAALEEWEMRLYGSEGEAAVAGVDPEQERELRQLWDARARLRDWLSPLNVVGINEDLDKAWLPATDHEEVKAVDGRIDKALAALANLGDTLRSSFHLLYIKTSEAQRERHERQQRRIELIAAGFLVPTLIVGFFGANTWVPGEHRHWGLTIMLAAMVVLTCIVMATLLASRRRYSSAPIRSERHPP
jgi:hypothetical protein